MMVWVAWDHTGDMVAYADTESDLWHVLSEMGWYADEVYVGRWTP